jgi:hypothetical protein
VAAARQAIRRLSRRTGRTYRVSKQDRVLLITRLP